MAGSPGNAPATGGLSIRAFAKTIGVSHTAIRKAIASGRLKHSVGQENGQPCIKDPALAKAEWAAGAGRLPRGAKAEVKLSAPPALQVATAETPPPPETTTVETSQAAATPVPLATSLPLAVSTPGTLAEANMRLAYQREVQLLLENQEKRGQLIDASEAKREAYRCARAVRDAFLNIPDRLAAELAAEPDAARVHFRLDGEIRQALELLHEVLAHGE